MFILLVGANITNRTPKIYEYRPRCYYDLIINLTNKPTCVADWSLDPLLWPSFIHINKEVPCL
jgi:hypothetical protein